MRNLHPILQDSEELLASCEGVGKTLVTLPYEELQKLMNSNTTGVLPAFKGKFGLVGKTDGGVEVKFYPCREEVERNGLNLSARELEKLKEQGVVYTETNIEGGRNRCFVQLDEDTNCLMVAKADDISQYFPSDIFGAPISREQRDTLREGKSIEVEALGQTYNIRVDLRKPCGFTVTRL